MLVIGSCCPDALRCEENPLRVHAVEDVAEPLPLLADEGVGGDLDVVQEDLGRRVVHHRRDRTDRQPLAGSLHVDEEDGDAVGLALDVFERRRACEQEHEVRVERARRPDLLPADDVAAVYAARGRLDAGRVRADGRLRHSERLQPCVSLGERRKVLALLLLASVLQEGAHRVHLRVRARPVPSGAVDLFKDDRGVSDVQPRPPVLGRDERPQPARLRQCPDELVGVFALSIDLAPVGVTEVSAELPDSGTDPLTVRVARKVHRHSRGEGGSRRGAAARVGTMKLRVMTRTTVPSGLNPRWRTFTIPHPFRDRDSRVSSTSPRSSRGRADAR